MHINKTPSDHERLSAAPLKPVHQLILLLLAKRATYGVDLLARIDEHSDGSIRLNAGSLYRLIGQLLDNGLLEAVEDLTSAGQKGAPRKSYAVTATGLQVLATEAKRQAELVEMARSLDLIQEG